MSQRSVVELQAQSNLTPSLRSALKAALGTLDVQLDEELARYRRSRSGSQMPSARIGQHYQNRRSLDLISVEVTGDKKSSEDGATTAPPAPSFVPIQSQVQEEQTQQPEQPDTPSSSLFSQFALTRATALDRSASITPSSVQELGGSLLDPATDHTGPEDYLESSEALLRSLGEERPQHRVEQNTEPNFSESLLTPLGIGSMLLLLLASATLGYVVMNPATVTALKDRLWSKPSLPTAINSTEPTNTTSASGEVLPLPDSPNLANREFVDLDLNTLSSVKPISKSPSVVPTAVPTAKATVAPTVQPGVTRSIATSTPLPQSVGVGLSAPPTQTAPLPVRRHHQKTATQQSESMLQPATAKYSSLPSSAKQQGQSLTSDGYYYVVTPYKSDRNLEKARGVVGDAYVDTSSQGTLIHLGAVKSEAEAQKLAEELQRRGIQARIYRP